MNEIRFQARQGDILLIETEGFHASLEQVTEVEPDEGALVIAVGESSGHRHQLAAQGSKLFARGSMTTLLEVSAKGGAVLEVTSARGERLPYVRHGPIPLREGRYEIRRQREWGPDRERRVQD